MFLLVLFHACRFLHFGFQTGIFIYADQRQPAQQAQPQQRLDAAIPAHGRLLDAKPLLLEPVTFLHTPALEVAPDTPFQLYRRFHPARGQKYDDILVATILVSNQRYLIFFELFQINFPTIRSIFFDPLQHTYGNHQFSIRWKRRFGRWHTGAIWRRSASGRESLRQRLFS